MRRARLVIAAIGIAGGAIADAWAFDVDQPLLWLPDLAVGVVLFVAGASLVVRVRGTGLLLTATGVAWFAGTVVPEATYWHRGVLVHLLVAYPGGRSASRGGWLVVGVGYAAAVSSPIWRDQATSLVAGCIALGVSAAGLRRARLRGQRVRQVACKVGTGLAAVVVLAAVACLAWPAEAVLPSLLAYEAALVVAVGILWTGLRPAAVTAVTDLVVELGRIRSEPLRDALADLLGDPAVRLGYWEASRAAYIDEAGGVLSPPAAGRQMLTKVDREGRPFAALLHGSLRADSTIAEAVAAAGRLTSAHAVLQAGIRTRVADVSASRRRLQRAVDEERRRLEQRLATTAESRLVGMSAELRRIPRYGDAHLARAVDQLERTLVDLHDAARGLYPRELADGLSSAVAALSSRCPVPVEVSVTRRRFDPEIEMAVYYLCAEALTNVAKHGAASAARVEAAVRLGALVVTVADDGVGGAAVAGGSGIRGLMDRVESVGGTLRVDSESGAGTTLAAEFPLGGQPR
ncbi:sensor histidine kinase [Actinoplanes sp. NPDC051513]|uniref:sensor histidine kinase n=1 Tax=Actinoplanes sp. NPDC051513 TaxID=3363908 RepID=UPI003792E147